MVGPWFTTPWRLVSQSHGAVAWCCRSSFPSHVPFPYATSRHWLIPSVSRTPYPAGLFCGPSHTPFPVPSPFYIIPCLYPTGPPATLWHGPTGSSSIRGPFRATSMGRSLPDPAPFPFAASPAYSPGLLCGPIPSHNPCLYPTGPPSTLWRGHTGSSSIRGPFRAPSTGCAPAAPAPYSCAASHAILVPWGRRVVLVTCSFLSSPLYPASHLCFCFGFSSGPPATLRRGPTRSAAFPGPVRELSTGRPLPAPFRLRGFFPSGLVVGPSSWPPRPRGPLPLPHVVTRLCWYCSSLL